MLKGDVAQTGAGPVRTGLGPCVADQGFRGMPHVSLPVELSPNVSTRHKDALQVCSFELVTHIIDLDPRHVISRAGNKRPICKMTLTHVMSRDFLRSRDLRHGIRVFVLRHGDVMTLF